METKVLNKLASAAKALKIVEPFDARKSLTTNPKGKKWKKRRSASLKGLVWHQELGWGSVEAVARYHTGKNSHLYKGGVESISYTFAIRRDGQIVLCNDFNRATWSQGYVGRKGDENAEFMSVMFEGLFHGSSVTDPSAGEPNHMQILSGMTLWHTCRDLWGWNDDDLYGHYHFGKPACPGDTLQAVIEAVRLNVQREEYDFTDVRGRQKALKELGFYAGKVDGAWGPASRGALIGFQKKHKLAADGIWGPKTESAISISLTAANKD